MRHPFLFAGALCAFSGVALGAFGAHGLKHLLRTEMLEVYKTGVSYQMWHGLGLMCIGLLQQQMPDTLLLRWSGRLLLCGIMLFCGSLYLLVLLDTPWLGMITPFGGLAFLAGWACLCSHLYRQDKIL